MASRARILTIGGSQAVRLPRECRFADDVREVVVSRDGSRVILEPLDEWPKQFLASLGAWRHDIERPAQQALADLRGEQGS